MPREAQTSINFDGTGAPCLFMSTSPLINLYAAQGVTFTGSGSILNQCSNFNGMAARSGTDFLAYSNGSAGSMQFSAVQGQFEAYFGATAGLNVTYFLGGSQVAMQSLSFGSVSAWNAVTYSGSSIASTTSGRTKAR